jgi:hypothetical protein
MSAAQINESLRALGASSRYTSVDVAWNDGQRGVVSKPLGLSCLGGNITDARIETRDGVCPFLRPSNHDETLGVVSADRILMADADGKQVSAQEVLDSLPERAKYRGYTAVDGKIHAAEKIVVRAQTCWVRIPAGSTDVVPTLKSYQTDDPGDPRNLIVLGTPSGVFVHNDAPGRNKLYAHSVDSAGTVTNHWFTAEPNDDCLVGHAAVDDDAPTKRARVVEMGIKGMGARTNCFVILQIPNTQRPRTTSRSCSFDDDAAPVYRSLGVSRSARVSVSDVAAGTARANATTIERVATEPIVATILTYNTLSGGADVATTDVALGVADLDRQYDLVTKNGGVVCKLSELPAMLHRMTPEHVERIRAVAAATTDPLTPTSNAMAMLA